MPNFKKVSPSARFPRYYQNDKRNLPSYLLDCGTKTYILYSLYFSLVLGLVKVLVSGVLMYGGP